MLSIKQKYGSYLEVPWIWYKLAFVNSGISAIIM